MLAVFSKSVAKSPEGLQSPESNSVSSLKDAFLAQHFESLNPSSVTLNLASSALLAYSLHKNNPLLPRYQSISHLFFSSYLCQTDHFFLFCDFLIFFLSGYVWKDQSWNLLFWILNKGFCYPFDPLNIWWMVITELLSFYYLDVVWWS